MARTALPLEQGAQFGRLTVASSPKKVNGKTAYLCHCVCGTKCVVKYGALTSGNTRSCGCMKRELWLSARTKHGELAAGRTTKLYWVWAGMNQRCENPKHTSYHKYGARGIQVCQEWQTSFASFRTWALATGYHEGLQIDRINNQSNYEPDNCRWANPAVNARNTRQNVLISAFGEAKTLGAWTEDPRCLVKYVTLAWRIRRGWTPERALTTPAQ